MKIRKFKRADIDQIVTLFYETVHTVCANDYSRAQLEAWAPDDETDSRIATWQESLCQHYAYVAESERTIIGFGDMTAAGYLDRLYVHKDYQRQGIASALLKTLEGEAQRLHLSEIRTDASITAKPFFERHGYQLVQSQSVVRRGVTLVNFKLVKTIT